jgi:hypothetical protein
LFSLFLYKYEKLIIYAVNHFNFLKIDIIIKERMKNNYK